MSSFYEEINKSRVITDEKENAQSRASVDKWIFRILLLILGFMPLIVMGSVKEVISPLVSNIDALSSGTKGDLFTSYKSMFLLISTITVSILFLAKIFFMNGKINKSLLNYFLLLFIVGILISTIVSPNISIALNGQYNRSDGAINWLCYLILMFIAMNIKYPRKAINYVLFSLYPFVIINLYIITTNFYGNDLLQKGWMRKFVSLFLPQGASIGQDSHLLGTLNQWNYMSGMFGILTLLFLGGAILEKHSKLKIAHFLICLCTMAVMLMAMSASGFFTLVCILPILIWLAIRTYNKKISLLLLSIFIIVSAGLIHGFSLQNSKVWDDSIGFFYHGENPYAEKEKPTAKINKSSKLALDGFLGNKVYAAEDKFELPVLPESGWSAGTGRTYIWKETLELVKDRPFFGYGLDTLVYHFPHTKLETRANLLVETVVDKPHNIYIGVLYGTGVLGFVAFISIVLITVFTSLKKIFKFNLKSNTNVVLCVAWLAFLIQALFNDTTPAIVATFFIMIGILMGLQLEEKEA